MPWGLVVAWIVSIAVTHAFPLRHLDNAQRGGAWTLHAPEDQPPCPRTGPPCRFITVDPVNSLFRVFERQWDETLSFAQTTTPRVTMRVSSTEISHMDKLTVSYQLHGLPGSNHDWIGVYCLDDQVRGLPDHEYIDWRWTNGRTMDTIVFGPLTNMRCVWQFRFFVGSDDGAPFTKLAETEIVRFHGGPTEPQQIHLAMTDDATTMRVSWTSATSGTASVWYGVSPDTLDQIVVANATTYHADDMCSAPATIVTANSFEIGDSLQCCHVETRR